MEDLVVDGRMTKLFLKEQDERVRAGLMRFRMEISGRLL